MPDDFSAISHYPLPPADMYEEQFLSGEWKCDAPGCGQKPEAPVHQPFQVRAGAVNADFGDTD